MHPPSNAKRDHSFHLYRSPIGGTSSKLSFWDPVIKKNERKNATWQGKLLSLGGRITLIKSAVSSLPLCYMSLFHIPKGVIAKINQLQRNFLRSEIDGKKSMALMVWGRIKLSNLLGGLSVGNLLLWNLALLLSGCGSISKILFLFGIRLCGRNMGILNLSLSPNSPNLIMGPPGNQSLTPSFATRLLEIGRVLRFVCKWMIGVKISFGRIFELGTFLSMYYSQDFSQLPKPLRLMFLHLACGMAMTGYGSFHGLEIWGLDMLRIWQILLDWSAWKSFNKS